MTQTPHRAVTLSVHRAMFCILTLVLAVSSDSCSGSPRYTRTSDSLIDQNPQRSLHKRNKTDLRKRTTGSSEKLLHGKASFYGPGFHGKKTASGEPFNQHDMTAAHRTLPFGTMVKVTNLLNTRSVIVRINDRGPVKKSRLIDLSHAAAQKIDMISEGIVPVTLEIVSSP